MHCLLDKNQSTWKRHKPVLAKVRNQISNAVSISENHGERGSGNWISEHGLSYANSHVYAGSDGHTMTTNPPFWWEMFDLMGVG